MKKIDWLLLGLIMGVSAGLRLWLVNGHVSFNYDQARDALIARQITAGDLKIMGPSASGTHDTVYHGVLFYYVIAVLYALAAGSPQVVAFSLALISTLGLIPLFFLAKNFFRSPKLALLTTALVAVSVPSISYGGWISEHMLGELFFPCYLYFCYQLYQRYSLRSLLGATLFLGLLEQAAVFNLYWALPLGLILLNTWRHRQVTLRRLLPHLLLAGFLLTLVVSTMIVTQILMVKRGILTPEVGQQFLTQGGKTSLSDRFGGMLTTLGRQLRLIVLPGVATSYSWGVVLIGLGIFLGHARLRRPNHFFLLFFLLAPLVLLIIYAGASNSQIWVGFESIVYLLLITAGYHLYRRFLTTKRTSGGWLALAGVIIFLGWHLNWLQQEKMTKHDFWRLPVQIGFDLSDQLALVEQTYATAGGQIFSFDSLTDPYSINVVWAYLYDWYGQNRYGYKPVFTGPSQAGYVSENILSEDRSLLATDSAHFVIVEPESTVNDFILGEFYDRQTPFGDLTTTTEFATLKLETYVQASLSGSLD